MTGTNPAAPHHIPWFVPSPDGSDPLMVVTGVILLVGTVGIGIFYFTLHSLPERSSHSKMQFEIVAILGLISLFTHMHIFWIIALILAFVDLPDFRTPLERIATALETRPSTGRAASVETRSREKAPATAGHET